MSALIDKKHIILPVNQWEKDFDENDQVIITNEDAQKIDEINKQKKVLTITHDFGEKQWKITRTSEFVGTIPLNDDKLIQIVPRGYPNTDISYQIIYGYVYDIDPTSLYNIQIGTKSINPFGSIFFANYLLNQISKIERHGLLSNYIDEVEESQFLKGKILWEKSFSKGYFPTERQFLQTSYLTRDILENRILKEALWVMYKSLNIKDSPELNTKKKIFMLYNKFYGINKLEDNPPQVVYHSQNQKYKKTIPVCLTIIKNKIPILNNNIKPIINNYAHFVNINDLFEDFLIKFLKEHLKQPKDAEKLPYKLIGKNRGGGNDWSYNQTPDITITNNKKEKIIIDAKNKPSMAVTSNPSIKDLRQMLVYSKFLIDPDTKEALQLTKVILPFPEPKKSLDEEFSFEPIDGKSISIYAKSIKLTTNELAKSMHNFLIYLHENFNIDFKSTNIDKCSCKIAKYQKIPLLTPSR